MFNLFKKSRKGKTVSKDELSQIDMICRGIGNFTKKKHYITFSTEENEEYGRNHFIEQPLDKSYWHRDLITQNLKYEYIFYDVTFELYINKITSVDKETAKKIFLNSVNTNILNLYHSKSEPFNHGSAINEVSALQYSTNVDNHCRPLNTQNYIEKLSKPRKAEKPEYQKNYDDYVKKEITRLKQSPILEIFKNELKIKQKPKVKKTYNHVFLSDKILVTHNDNWFSEFKDHIDKFFIGVSKNV